MTMSAALDVTRRLDWGRVRRKERWSRMMPFVGGDGMIEMVERRHGYFPQVFVWRGRRYDVHAVERCWTVARRGLWRRVERTCFRVRARSRWGHGRANGTYDVYQDGRDGSWHMLRQVAGGCS